MATENIIFGLILSLFAGLSTAIGALVIFLIKNDNTRIISISMGFSAGVMIGVSVFELLPEALSNLGTLTVGLLFLLGMLIVAILDFIVPHEYMYEQIDSSESQSTKQKAKLMKTGLLTAFGIGIHNFPEGLVTMSGSLFSLKLGLILAIAISFHNIPEGLSVAIPIYAATNNRKKGFFLSFLSGFAEPIGAGVGLFVIIILGGGIIDQIIIQSSLAFVAGIMIFISIDELLPCAHETCNSNGSSNHIVTIGIITGITVILLSLIII